MKAMRMMKAVQAKGGKLSDLPPPPPSNYDHYVECRYCGRKYAADVAERHIPKCANIINKPGGIKPSRIQEKYIAGTGSGVNKISGGYGASPMVGGNKSSIVPSHKPNFASSSVYGNQVASQVKPSNMYGIGNQAVGQIKPANSNNSYSYDKGE
jgi:hypothetical protein